MFLWTVYMVACDFMSCAVNLLVCLLLAFSVPACQDCRDFLISCAA
jgi:hypothetical protein